MAVSDLSPAGDVTYWDLEGDLYRMTGKPGTIEAKLDAWREELKEWTPLRNAHLKLSIAQGATQVEESELSGYGAEAEKTGLRKWAGEEKKPESEPEPEEGEPLD